MLCHKNILRNELVDLLYLASVTLDSSRPFGEYDVVSHCLEEDWQAGLLSQQVVMSVPGVSTGRRFIDHQFPTKSSGIKQTQNSLDRLYSNGIHCQKGWCWGCQIYITACY